MIDSIFYELLAIVGFVIQPYDLFHTQFLENWHIVQRSKSSILNKKTIYAVFVNWFVRRTAKCNKFLRNNPIQVSIFYFFIVLIFCQVKGLIVEPTQLHCVLQTTKAVQQLNYPQFYSAFIAAFSIARISERSKVQMLKRFKSLFRGIS